MSTDTPETTATGGISKRRVAELIARRRQNITDDHVVGYDEIDENGHKVKTVKKDRTEAPKSTYTVDLTATTKTGPSTTSSLEILIIEAEQAADGRDRMNPHIPANDEVLEQAVERIEEEDLVPAWEVIDG